VAVSVMVDQLASSNRSQLPKVHALVTYQGHPPNDE
jgi:hypothetical protein